MFKTSYKTKLSPLIREIVYFLRQYGKATPFEIHQHFYQLERENPNALDGIKLNFISFFSERVEEGINDSVQRYIIEQDGRTYSLTGYGRNFA